MCVSPSVRNIYLDGKMQVGGERGRGQLEADCVLHEVAVKYSKSLKTKTVANYKVQNKDVIKTKLKKQMFIV